MTVQPVPGREGRWSVWVLGPVTAVYVTFGTLLLWNAFFPASRWPGELEASYRVVAPFESLNGYGLFRQMTRERPEIVVEGSDDGEHWLVYRFRWKPGDVDRRPRFVAPYQPRLDWQMWFAALGSYQDDPWFTNFMVKLLQGSPPVLALLADDPFPQKPPRYVRALLYQYHFTDRATRARTGDWWRRDLKGLYCPAALAWARRRARPGGDGKTGVATRRNRPDISPCNSPSKSPIVASKRTTKLKR